MEGRRSPAGRGAGRRPRRRAAALVALAAALVASAGCEQATRRVFRTPEATFAGVDVRSVDFGGASLDVLVALRNPNPYALTARSASYRVMIEGGQELGRGRIERPLTLAAGDSAVVALPLRVDWGALGRGGRAMLRDGETDYVVIGEIDARTPIGSHTFPIEARGRAALRR